MNIWLENVAKFEIGHRIHEILRSSGSQQIQILDVGAGTGGDWDALVEKYPNLKLYLWEPYEISGKILKARFQNSTVTVLDNLIDSKVKFDYIISLSVLEHVKNLNAHFEMVKNLLNEKGQYICNFDDGHFRYNSKNIWSLSSNRIAISETFRTVISRFFTRIYSTGKYQSRVNLDELKSIVESKGLLITAIDYRNIGDLKGASKLLKNKISKHDFAESWLNLEKMLNSKLDGHQSSLAELFLSRTAYICHAEKE